MHFTALRQSRLTQINFGGNPRAILLPDLNGVTLHAARHAASRVGRVASDDACPRRPDRRTTRQGFGASQLRALPRDRPCVEQPAQDRTAAADVAPALSDREPWGGA